MTGLDARLVVDRGDTFRLDLPLVIPPGRTVALLGPNGAGKSTAVAALAGIVPLAEGSITLGGAVLDDPASGVFVPPERRRIGVVFQDYLLFPHLDVAENVAFGMRSGGAGRAEAHRKAEEWIERVGLGGLGGRRPRDLSGGQAQRVALARALATEPELLLLDEPLAALDVSTRAELRHTLGEHLSAFDGPRLLITHDPVEAFVLADEIHVIEGGVVTQVGVADDIRLRPRTPYAADLAGSNLLTGTAAGGVVETGTFPLHIVDSSLRGPVLVTIRPAAISVHRRRPEGSPRNVWETVVAHVEDLGERARVRIGPPLPLTVEITAAAARALELAEGTAVWVAVKSTEIGVEADA